MGLVLLSFLVSVVPCFFVTRCIILYLEFVSRWFVGTMLRASMCCVMFSLRHVYLGLADIVSLCLTIKVVSEHRVYILVYFISCA